MSFDTLCEEWEGEAMTEDIASREEETPCGRVGEFCLF